jgi:hypothetical protein
MAAQACSAIAGEAPLGPTAHRMMQPQEDFVRMRVAEVVGALSKSSAEQSAASAGTEQKPPGQGGFFAVAAKQGNTETLSNSPRAPANEPTLGHGRGLWRQRSVKAYELSDPLNTFILQHASGYKAQSRIQDGMTLSRTVRLK